MASNLMHFLHVFKFGFGRCHKTFFFFESAMNIKLIFAQKVSILLRTYKQLVETKYNTK